MVSPLICLIKHRKKKSVFKRLMCIHIPTSMLYHLSAAFPARIPALVTNTMKALDFSMVHALNVASRIDFNRKKHLQYSIALHAMLVQKSVMCDLPVQRFALMLYDNMHLYNTAAIKYGFLAFSLYFADNFVKGSHGAFHITLYWLFDTYFSAFSKRKSI